MTKSNINEEPVLEEQESSEETPGADYLNEEEEGLYGWKFHRGPLLAAIVLSVLFYLFIFFWVE